MLKVENQPSNDVFTFCSPISVENSSNDIFNEIEIKEWEETMEECCKDSGMESLDLWKKERALLGCALCPSSQAQDTAGYTTEILDMIQDIPESDYDLSLRDLAELSKAARCKEDDSCMKKEKARKKNGGRRKASDTMSGGFLLKMLVPPSPVSGRRSAGSCNGASKISSKSQAKHEQKSTSTSRSSSSSTEKNIIIATTTSRKKKKHGCFLSF